MYVKPVESSSALVNPELEGLANLVGIGHYGPVPTSGTGTGLDSTRAETSLEA